MKPQEYRETSISHIDQWRSETRTQIGSLALSVPWLTVKSVSVHVFYFRLINVSIQLYLTILIMFCIHKGAFAETRKAKSENIRSSKYINSTVTFSARSDQ